MNNQIGYFYCCIIVCSAHCKLLFWVIIYIFKTKYVIYFQTIFVFKKKKKMPLLYIVINKEFNQRVGHLPKYFLSIRPRMRVNCMSKQYGVPTNDTYIFSGPVSTRMQGVQCTYASSLRLTDRLQINYNNSNTAYVEICW